MKQFDVNYNDLYNFSDNPRIYLPLTNELLGDSEHLIATLFWGEREIMPNKDYFDFNTFLNNIPNSKDKKYLKKIKEFKEDCEEGDYDEDEFETFVNDNDLWEDYLNDYLESLNINYIEIEVTISGFGCGGGPVGDIMVYYVEDKDNKLSNLSEKEFLKLITDKCSKDEV